MIPLRAITKYMGHSLIQMTHILPGALWAGTIIFQLCPAIREKNPKLHKMAGCIFLITSFLMAFGILVILARKLTFIHDYDDVIAPVSHQEFLRVNFSAIVSTVWFVFAAVIAVFKASSRDYQSHRSFILLHIGSGIWIALQRLIVTIATYGGIVRGGSLQMRNLFHDAALFGAVVTVLASEYAVRLLNRQRQQQLAGLSKRKIL